MQIGYIVYDLNDAATLRRARMLTAGGADLRLAGFRRGALSSAAAAFSPTELGVTRDAALTQRALAVGRNCLLPSRARRALGDAKVLIARNLESLAIARRIADGRPIVYECLDIHRSLLGQGIAARAIQRAEGLLLPAVDLVWTSSPAFVRDYFAHRPQLRAPVTLVENKLLELNGTVVQPAPAPAAPPYVIGWFGMLRCRRTLAELKALAGALAGRIEVLIAGKPSAAEFADFAGEVAGSPHMTYVGTYGAADLPGLYARCHFAWTIDWFEEGLNSRWLLPNRLYEASAFGAVPIALEGVEVGRWLAQAGAGLRVADAGELKARLAALAPGDYAAMREAVAALPRERLVAGPEACRALVDELAQLVRR